MRRINQQEGAVAVFVAIMIVVLIGMGAIVIDVGQLYAERRQLQNGADAAALAIAQVCAADPACDLGDADTMAHNFARDNTKDADGHGRIQPGSFQPITVGSNGQVTTQASTRDLNDPADTTGVQFQFARIFGFDEQPVQADATAMWGGGGLPAVQKALPITPSMCDFMGGAGPWTPAQLDAKAASLPTVDDLPRSPSGQVTGGQIVSLHDAADGDACTFAPGFSGEGSTPMPGGFGWLELDSPADACELNIVEHEEDGQFWVPAVTGVGAPEGGDCLVAQLQQAPILPIFTGFRTSPKEYRLYAPAAFFITGYRISGHNGGTPPPSCPGPGGSGQCIRGHFVQKVVPDLPPGPGLGVNTFWLTG